MQSSAPPPSRLRAYVVARPGLPARAVSPDFDAPLRIDPTRTESEGFLSALERLDELAYEPLGMATPRWALYDCAELPGAVLGLCAPSELLPAEVAQLLGASQASWLPLTFLMAVPSVERNRWLVHSVCDLAEVMQTGTRDLRPATMRFAYPWLGVERVTGICQWNGDRLALHARWGPLQLGAAWLPSHDHPGTCVFHYTPDPTRERSGSIPPRTAFSVDPEDEAQLQGLQAELESGVGLRIVDVANPAQQHRVWLVRTEGS